MRFNFAGLAICSSHNTYLVQRYDTFLMQRYDTFWCKAMIRLWCNDKFWCRKERGYQQGRTTTFMEMTSLYKTLPRTATKSSGSDGRLLPSLGLVGRRLGTRKIDLQKSIALRVGVGIPVGRKMEWGNLDKGNLDKTMDITLTNHKKHPKNIVPECHRISSSGRQTAPGEQTTLGTLQVGCLLVDGQGVGRGVLVGVEEVGGMTDVET